MIKICANCEFVKNSSDDEPFICTLKNLEVGWNQKGCEDYNCD